MSPALLGLLLALGAVLAHVMATVASVRYHRRRARRASRMPSVSVLKPLCGVDDRLEENLESLFGIDYPDFEVLFGAERVDEPALAVARGVAARRPEVPCRIVVGSLRTGLNPKVRVLARMTELARGELVAVSDSNVRVRPSWLRETVAELEDGSVAVVSNLVAGVGERSLGATLENLQLNGFVAPAMCLGIVLGRPPCLVGKSMVVRRADLQAVGGWAALGGVLAEDYLLGRLLEARGRRAAISPHVVETVNERWSLARFVERHDRWLKMRWRISPWAVTLEMATNVTAMSLLWVALAGATPGAVAGAAACVAARAALDAIAWRSLVGRWASPTSLLLVPLRDLALAALWLHARLSARARWRGGRVLLIGPGTALTAPRPALRPRRLRPRLETVEKASRAA